MGKFLRRTPKRTRGLTVSHRVGTLNRQNHNLTMKFTHTCTQKPFPSSFSHTHCLLSDSSSSVGMCAHCSCRLCKMIPHYPGCLYSAGKSAGRQRRGVTVAAVYSQDDGGRWARERPAASPAIDASLTELAGWRTMVLKATQLKVIENMTGWFCLGI